MCIGIQGEACGEVAQHAGHRLDVHAVLQRDGCKGVAEVMESDLRDASPFQHSLLRAGLLKGSFIPDKAFRELRHLTRYRKSVVHGITAQKNRIDKFLQSSGFRFTAFLSGTFGASGRNIIRHLIEHGSIDREALDKCLKTKTRNRIDEILVALNGSLSIHQRRFLNMVFQHAENRNPLQ